MPVKKGDFITLNYTCKIKETNEIVESTKEIKKQSLEKQEEKIYEPKLVVVGEEIIPKGWVPKGLDESLEVHRERWPEPACPGRYYPEV